MGKMMGTVTAAAGWLCACLAVCTSADTLTWTGGGGASNVWSNPANWSSTGSHTTPQSGDDVVIGSFAASGTSVQDIAGLNLYGLSVTQSHAVTQTLQLAQPLTVNDGVKTTIPVFNVTAGGLILDIGSASFSWDTSDDTPTGPGGDLPVIIPGGMTVQLAGGALGTSSAQNTLKIAAGGKLAGTGNVYGTTGNPSWGGYRGLVVEDGGMIEVGDGLLYIDTGYQAQFFGALQGTTANSSLQLGQNNRFWTFTGSDTTEIGGLSELRVSTKGSSFGRFGDPSQIDLAGTIVHVNAPSNPGALQWEAQTTVDDLSAYKLGGIKVSGGFSTYAVTFQLVDTGSVDGDFVYAGTLDAVGSLHRIDLNGIALLTDMGETSLAAMIAGGNILNSGPGGSPMVKSVDMYGQTYWYVAPADVSITAPPPAAAEIPEPASALLVLTGAAGLAARRRRRA